MRSLSKRALKKAFYASNGGIALWSDKHKIGCKIKYYKNLSFVISCLMSEGILEDKKCYSDLELKKDINDLRTAWTHAFSCIKLFNSLCKERDYDKKSFVVIEIKD